MAGAAKPESLGLNIRLKTPGSNKRYDIAKPGRAPTKPSPSGVTFEPATAKQGLHGRASPYAIGLLGLFRYLGGQGMGLIGASKSKPAKATKRATKRGRASGDRGAAAASGDEGPEGAWRTALGKRKHPRRPNQKARERRRRGPAGASAPEELRFRATAEAARQNPAERRCGHRENPRTERRAELRPSESGREKMVRLGSCKGPQLALMPPTNFRYGAIHGAVAENLETQRQERY